MSSDYTDTGTYAHIVSKRDEMVERMTPSARASHFPTLYARPLPVDHTSAASRQMIVDLQAKNTELRAVIAALKKDNQRLILENGKLYKAEEASRHPLVVVVPTDIRSAPVAEVMSAFCRTLESAGYLLEGTACTVAHLQAERRTRAYAYPRHVAMWLCRQICTRVSLALISKAFGNRDHSTIMNGCRKAPGIMKGNPTLHAVACAVLADFEKR